MEKIDLCPKVLEIIRLKGPVIPRDIVKEIGGDTFIVGALLAQLREENKIKISKVKIGGSPTYYYPGQEHKLQNLAKYLNEKDKKAYDNIKKYNVLRDTEQSPLMRVALRQIRDFAKPLEVNISGQKEIFWKWYMTSNIELEPVIKKIIGIKEPKKKPVQQGGKTTENIKVEKTEPKITVQLEGKKQNTLKKADETVSLLDDAFNFFKSNQIQIVEKKELRKKKEYDFILNVKTTVGEIRYYARVKEKKKCNEGDISTAYVKAQSKKLPLLFLVRGELTKKAMQMINDKEFENFTLKKI